MKLATALLGLAYPLLIYVGLSQFDIRHVALAILLLAALRVALSVRADSWGALRAAAAPFVLVAGLVGLAAWLDDERFFLFVPVFINAALLFGFARTLWHGPPIVETFARLQVQDLSPVEVSYCRSVTRLWCGFFGLNGGVALALALFASLEAWTVYNGLVAYLLIGMLFSAEFIYRTWRFRRYEGGLTDRVFRRIFPPRQPS